MNRPTAARIEPVSLNEASMSAPKPSSISGAWRLQMSIVATANACAPLTVPMAATICWPMVSSLAMDQEASASEGTGRMTASGHAASAGQFAENH